MPAWDICFWCQSPQLSIKLSTFTVTAFCNGFSAQCCYTRSICYFSLLYSVYSCWFVWWGFCYYIDSKNVFCTRCQRNICYFRNIGRCAMLLNRLNAIAFLLWILTYRKKYSCISVHSRLGEWGLCYLSYSGDTFVNISSMILPVWNFEYQLSQSFVEPKFWTGKTNLVPSSFVILVDFSCVEFSPIVHHIRLKGVLS